MQRVFLTSRIIFFLLVSRNSCIKLIRKPMHCNTCHKRYSPQCHPVIPHRFPGTSCNAAPPLDSRSSGKCYTRMKYENRLHYRTGNFLRRLFPYSPVLFSLNSKLQHGLSDSLPKIIRMNRYRCQHHYLTILLAIISSVLCRRQRKF